MKKAVTLSILLAGACLMPGCSKKDAALGTLLVGGLGTVSTYVKDIFGLKSAIANHNARKAARKAKAAEEAAVPAEIDKAA